METYQVEAVDMSSDEDKKEIAELASEQVALEAEVARIEATLEEAKSRLYRVRDDMLPQAMLNAGMLDFTLVNGWKVQVRDHYQCGQLDDAPPRDEKEAEKKRPLEERLAALQWLEDNQAGSLARRTVSVSLGADAIDLAEEIIALIRHHPKGNQLQIDNRRIIPWNTLAAFAREQMAIPHDIPLDVLGVTVRRSAKITAPEDPNTPKHPFKRGRR